MNMNNRYTWIFRCYDTALGEVYYKVRHLLTVREAKSFAIELIGDNPKVCVSLFKKYKLD